jgi:cell division inhibitor SepF
MGAMYKLKAYFGMVPADELGEYEDDRYPTVRRAARERGWDTGEDRWDSGEDVDRYDERQDRYFGRYAARDDRDRDELRDDRVREDRTVDHGDADRYGERRPARTVAAERPLPPPVRTIAGPTSVRGSLAMDPGLLTPLPSGVPEQRERAAAGAAALSRITTLQPSSYNEARTIGERYREGIPVIMNLSELDDASAKRLVDFAAGLVFALHGGFDKVTNRVFLLTPADVEVSAEDARRLVGRVGR